MISLEIFSLAYPTPAIKTYDKLGKVIHISSFSKTIAPAIRIGWIVASEK